MNYLDSLKKAIIYIEANLCEDLKVEDVAKHIGYSYYHLARIFEALLGESVGNYIRKRRLSQAAHALVYTDKKIIDLALSFQFQSAEAFTRAFKKVYKVSPYTYRKNKIEGMFGNKEKLNTTKIKHLSQSVSLQPVIKQISPIKVIGIRKHITLQNNELMTLWDDFNNRAEEIVNPLMPVRCFGICEYEETIPLQHFNNETLHSQFIGMEITGFEIIPDEMLSKTIKGGPYAIFTHTGPISLISETYKFIFGTWLPSCHLELAAEDSFELYDERFKGRESPLSQMDIYLPLK